MNGVIAPSRRAVLLTCYMTSIRSGTSLGSPGYSYEFVAKLFWPLLERWGEVIPVPEPEHNLDQAVAAARQRGLEPIHVSFLPFQDATLAADAPNIVVPFWEYPNIPDHAFDDNPRNDWTVSANECDGIFVAGDFTRGALQSGGITTPMHTVPVPSPEEYFELSDWHGAQSTTLNVTGYFPRVSSEISDSSLNKIRRRLDEALRKLSGSLIARFTPVRLLLIKAERMTVVFKSRTRAGSRQQFELPYHQESQLDLTGVVYTTVFNPSCGRKNWFELLTAFQIALGDREDATLLVKLVTTRPREAIRVMRHYMGVGIPHRCRVIFICDYLDESEMVDLAAASTYYIQTTRAEGSCLPLRNFMSAGRPGVSPRHSAIQDYFDREVGFPVESHPEPTAWPHDKKLRWTTSWARLVWPSLISQIKESYRIATESPDEYQQLADRCRERMSQWSDPEAVWKLLEAGLTSTSQRPRQPESHTPPASRAA